MHACVHAYIRTYVHAYIRTYVHTYIRTYVHTYTYIYIYIYCYRQMTLKSNHMLLPSFLPSFIFSFSMNSWSTGALRTALPGCWPGADGDLTELCNDLRGMRPGFAMLAPGGFGFKLWWYPELIRVYQQFTSHNSWSTKGSLRLSAATTHFCSEANRGAISSQTLC